MDEHDNPIVQETKKQMDIVPYTKRDRIVTYAILVVVLANFLTLILSIPWGSLFS